MVVSLIHYQKEKLDANLRFERSTFSTTYARIGNDLSKQSLCDLYELEEASCTTPNYFEQTLASTNANLARMTLAHQLYESAFIR